MSTKNDLWMPLFVADYLSATTHLHGAEHGAYLLLIMHAWKNGGRIPTDDRQLARIARLNAREWRAAKPVVMAFWTADGDGYTHGRILAELARAAHNVEQRSAAGRASAEARARQRKGNGRSTDVGTDVATNGQQTGRPSPSPYSDTNVSGASAPIDPDKKAWREGIDLLMSHGLDERKARTFVGKLVKDSGGEARALLPIFAKCIEIGSQDPQPYLTKAVASLADRRSGGSAPPPSTDPAEPIDWARRMDAWRSDRIWPVSMWGPNPDEKGCQCPPELLEA